MYSKLLRENSALGFPNILSLHTRSMVEADRLGVFMESLRQVRGLARKALCVCVRTDSVIGRIDCRTFVCISSFGRDPSFRS